MPSKIRLQRRGKKGQPFYHIVIADGRAPRDGKFIEKIGTYNPLTKPADIVLDFDRALYWLQNGSQPTDTARAILSHQGVMYKLHLQKGIAKGALTQEQADARFETWFREKQEKISTQVKTTEQESKNEIKKRLEAERKVNEARAADIAAKRLAELKMIESKRAAAQKEEEPAAETEQEVTAEVDAATAEPAVEVEQPMAETDEEPAEKAEEPVAVVEESAEEVKEPESEASSEEPSTEAEVPVEEPSEESKAPAEEPSKEEEAPEKAE
jgi:small subunit ribosomal protein S16